MKYQNFNMMQKVKCVSGDCIEISYRELCHTLEIIPDIHFLVVTKSGYIDFTCGKPQEILYLANKCREHGFLISRSMRATLSIL